MLTITPADTPTYQLVRPVDGAPWVALIHHPVGSRRWHVHARTGQPVTFRTRRAMLAYLVDTFGPVLDD